MLDRKTVLHKVRDFLTEAAANGDRDVLCAYLYGSHAEGRAHRESDVDIAVLLRWDLDRRQRWDRRIELTSDLIAVLHCNEVDLVVLNEVSPLLGRRVVQEGKPLYCADPEAEHAYRRDVQLRAADLVPFIEHHRRRLLEVICA